MFCICVEDVENLCLYLIHSSFYTNKRLVLLNFIREINNCRPSGRLYSTVPMRKIAVRKNLTIFSIWTFFHEHSRITGLQGKGEDISLHGFFFLEYHYSQNSRGRRGLSLYMLSTTFTRFTDT